MKALKFVLVLLSVYETFAVEEDCPEVIDRICAATDVPSLNIKPYLWFANKCFFEKAQKLGTNNFASLEIVPKAKCENYDSCVSFENTCKNIEHKTTNLQCVSSNGIDFYDFQNTCEVLGWQCYDEILVFVGMGTCNSTQPFEVVN
ncbi:hypothetical protein ACFFRR_002153 [Megaselia abdita]